MISEHKIGVKTNCGLVTYNLHEILLTTLNRCRLKYEVGRNLYICYVNGRKSTYKFANLFKMSDALALPQQLLIIPAVSW